MEASAGLVVIRPPKRWRGFGLRELWRYRELLYFLAWRDLKVRYKQTFLGVSWAVVQPIMYMIVFTLFFGKLVGLYRPAKVPYALITLSGSVIWLFFANSVTLAANSLVGSASLITKVYFPRLIASVAPVLAAVVDLALAIGVLLVMMGAYSRAPSWRFAIAIPFVLLAMGTAIGVGSWLSALNVKYRDVRYVVPFLMQVWMFASAVFYVFGGLDLPQPWRTLYWVNPMAGVVEGFRWSVLGGVHPSYGQVALSTLGGAVLLLCGLLYHRRMERQFADII